jgi:hypothetical protein
MSEKDLIKFLSDESEKMLFESFDEKDKFDTEICGWKDINPQSTSIQSKDPETARFRIRTVPSRGTLSRSNSSKSQLSTLSSGQSGNNSPCRDGEKSVKTRKQLATLCSGIGDPPFPSSQIVDIKFHRPPKARKSRKPIKVFKLPNVSQENDE